MICYCSTTLLDSPLIHGMTNSALSEITLDGGGQTLTDKVVTLQAGDVVADFSHKQLGRSGLIVLSAFLGVWYLSVSACTSPVLTPVLSHKMERFDLTNNCLTGYSGTDMEGVAAFAEALECSRFVHFHA